MKQKVLLSHYLCCGLVAVNTGLIQLTLYSTVKAYKFNYY